jgi:hypothetical protein
MLERICSGGQSGVDTGALLAAYALDIPTSGWAPEGWLTEAGPEEEFMRAMGLTECTRAGYAARTELNVKQSDGTLIVSDSPQLTGGTYDTLCCAESLDKPVYQVWITGDGRAVRYQLKSGSRVSLMAWLRLMDIQVLNVAGPRASKWPQGCRLTCEYLMEALG